MALKLDSVRHVSTLLQQKNVRRDKMYSLKVWANKDRIKKNGDARVYLMIIINREKSLINLNIDWPFHLITQKGISQRYKNDKECNDLQLVIDQRLARVNEIFIEDRLNDQNLTTQKLKYLYENFDSKKDFVKYMQEKIEFRYKNGLIKNRTYQNSRGALNLLKSFNESILFSDINEVFLQKLRVNLHRLKYKPNTIAGVFKNIKAYLHLAKKDGIRIDDVLSKIKAPQFQKTLTYLTEEEVSRLYEVFKMDVEESIKKVLRYFLFSIETGVRISDVSRITHSEISKDRVLTFNPFKTREMGKAIQIPLTNTALSLIQNKHGLLFNCFKDAVTNRYLKKISELAGINKKLTFHVARHTFSTLFLSRGGRVEVLQKLLGHEKIETTMVYVHVDISRLKKEMALMEKGRDIPPIL